MSDSARKDFSDKVHDKVKPDSQKSTYEKGKESVTNGMDHMAAKMTPESHKSTSQEAADSAHDAKKDAKSSGDSYMTQAKNAISEKMESAKEYMESK